MDVSYDSLLEDLAVSERAMSEGTLSKVMRAMSDLLNLVRDAKKICGEIEIYASQIPSGKVIDDDGDLSGFLENAYSRVESLLEQARRIRLFGAIPLLHLASFYLLRSRYVILTHDFPDLSIPEPYMHRTTIGEVFAAVLGGPWAVASLLKK